MDESKIIDFDPIDVVTIKNPLGRDYEYIYGGQSYIIKRDESRPIPAPMATYLSEMLTKELMIQEGSTKMINDIITFDEFASRVVVDSTPSVPVEMPRSEADLETDKMLVGEKKVFTKPDRTVYVADQELAKEKEEEFPTLKK